MDAQPSLFDWANVSLETVCVSLGNVDNRSLLPFSKPSTEHLRAVPRIWISSQGELDLKSNVVALVPRDRYLLLSYRLTEFFLQQIGPVFLKYGFALEKSGFCFVGDCVQGRCHDLARCVGSKRIYSRMRSALERMELNFDMLAPQWRRPNDRFASRHYAATTPKVYLRLA